MESTRKVISNSVIYTISGLLLRCFSFFLLPLYTAFLTTEDYGITSIANSFIATMSFIVALSTYSAISRFYVDYKDDPIKVKRIYGTISTFVFVSTVVWDIILFIFRDELSKRVFQNIDFFPVVFLCLISLLFYCQHTIFSTILISEQKAVKSSILNTIYFLVNLGLNVLFVVIMQKGAVGVILATLIANLLYSLYFIIDLLAHKNIIICVDLKPLKDILKYSIPLLPHNLSTSIALLVSKILIGDTNTLSTVGVYSIASTFGDISDTVQGYINTAYVPWFFEQIHGKNDNYIQTIRNAVKALCAITGFFFIGISLFSHDCILLLLNKSYSEAWKYVPFIVGVYAIKTAYYFYVSILFYDKKASKILFIATITGSLINILLSYIFIPIWGVYGSIAADAVGMIIRTVIVIAISQRFNSEVLSLKPFIINFVVTLALVFAGIAPAYIIGINQFSLLFFGYKVLVLAGYVIYVYITNIEIIKPVLNDLRKKLIKR